MESPSCPAVHEIRDIGKLYDQLHLSSNHQVSGRCLCASSPVGPATTPQTRLKGIVHTPGNSPLVARKQVKIDGASKYDPDDDGEFEFDLAGDLKVGQPATMRERPNLSRYRRWEEVT